VAAAQARHTVSSARKAKLEKRTDPDWVRIEGVKGWVPRRWIWE